MPPYNYQLLLKRLIQQGVAWAPDQEIIYRGHLRFTYRLLYERILRLGSALQALGVGPGTRVGVLEWDSHRYLEMYFGIPGIGAAMHTINPGLAPEQILYTIQHAGDEILIFHEDFTSLVEKLCPGLPAIRQYILIRDGGAPLNFNLENKEYEELLASAVPLTELPDNDENTLATISYTTGTTGTPKGVSFTQRQLTLQTLCDAIALSALGRQGGVNKRDVYMPLTPMYHGHAWGMPYVAAMLGLKLVFPGRYQIPLILQLLQDEGVTFSHCVPTIMQAILTGLKESGLARPGWKVIVGGAAMTRNLASEAASLGIDVYGGYGLSETAPVLTIANLKPFMETWETERQLDWTTRPGFPIPLVDLRVFNRSREEVRHDGVETGEVMVRTPWCTPGYLQDEAGSADLWADSWLHTGDLANIDEYGYIQIVDRLKDTIKSGGEWIVSLELEKFIGQCEGVLEAAVIGVPDEKWGERPLAIVKSRTGYQNILTAETLRIHLEEYIAKGMLNSWAIPDNFIFVDEIPKTSVGKYNKKELRRLYVTSRL
jgi:fatty-acyl-CoA synthase